MQGLCVGYSQQLSIQKYSYKYKISYLSINVWSLVMVIVCLHFCTVISTSHRRRRFGPARKLIDLNSPALSPFYQNWICFSFLFRQSKNNFQPLMPLILCLVFDNVKPLKASYGKLLSFVWPKIVTTALMERKSWLVKKWHLAEIMFWKPQWQCLCRRLNFD